MTTAEKNAPEVVRSESLLDPPARRMDPLTAARGLLLMAAFASFVFSVSLWFSGNRDEGMFVGIWSPTILSLGAFLIPRRTRS